MLIKDASPKGLEAPVDIAGSQIEAAMYLPQLEFGTDMRIHLSDARGCAICSESYR